MRSGTPIETMLESVEWTAVDSAQNADDELPYATHEGVLEIAGVRLRCYRLNTGQAIFNADDVHEFFGGALAMSHPTGDADAQ